MNNRNISEELTDINDNKEIDNVSTVKKYSDTVSKHVTFARNSIRNRFAQKCEESFLACFMDNLYYRILNCSIKAFAVFLMTFGFLSLLFRYLLEYDGLKFFFNINTIISVIILVIGIIFLTSKKTVAELLVGSASLSYLSVVYSQSAVFSANSTISNQSSFSTALFVGIISGIITIFFPAVYIVIFLLSLLYCLFIFNRPECGLMLTLVAIPLLNNVAVLMLCVITFIGVFYKYLRVKRHIDASPLLVLCMISMVYFACRGYFTYTGLSDFIDTLSYIAFVFVFIITVSLIRSTSMLTKAINLIVAVSRIYLVIFIAYYVSCVIFDKSLVNSYLSLTAFDGARSAVTDMSFFALLLSLAVPLNFAVMISSKNASGFIKNVIYLVLMIMCMAFVSTVEYALITLFACALILICLKKRFAVFTLLVPAISFGLNFLFKKIPQDYLIEFFVKEKVTGDYALSVIKQHLPFGIGIGKNNAGEAVYHASSGAANSCVTGNTYLSLLLTVGIIGALLILAMIVIMLIKNAEFIFNSDTIQSNKVRILSAGLFSSSLSFILNSMFLDCTRDFRIVCFFAIVLSLGYTCKQCFDSDYIDLTMVREYK